MIILQAFALLVLSLLAGLVVASVVTWAYVQFFYKKARRR